MAKSLGITTDEWRNLLDCRRSPNEGKTSQELADKYGITQQAVLKRIRKLKAEGRVRESTKVIMCLGKRPLTVPSYVIVKKGK